MFSYIITRASHIQGDDNDVGFILDQHAYLDLHSPSSQKRQLARTSTRTRYPNSETTNLCTFSVMMYA